MNIQKARKGSIHRARKAYNQGCDIRVGNEGFATEISGEYFLSTVTIVYGGVELEVKATPA